MVLMVVLPNNTLLPSVKMMMNVRTRRIPFLSPVREEGDWYSRGYSAVSGVF